MEDVKLTLGRIVVMGKARRLPSKKLEQILARHASGDWGDVSPELRAYNDAAAQQDDLVLSRYQTTIGRVSLTTLGDRYETTVEVESRVLSWFNRLRWW